jgi:hypothetical protein
VSWFPPEAGQARVNLPEVIIQQDSFFKTSFLNYFATCFIGFSGKQKARPMAAPGF